MISEPLQQATVQVIETPRPDNAGDQFMRTVFEEVVTMSQQSSVLEDDTFTYTTIQADNMLGMRNLLLQGYEPAYGHPLVNEEKKVMVFRADKAQREALYITEQKALMKKLMSNPDAKPKAAIDPMKAINRMPENDQLHHPVMEALLKETEGHDPSSA